MAQVIKTSEGKIVLSGGRSEMAADTAARGQLLTARAVLERGDDAFRPSRGVRFSELKAARSSPTLVAIAIQEELELEPLVIAADVQPIGDGYISRTIQTGEPSRAYSLRGDITVSNEQSPIDVGVEVSLG